MENFQELITQSFATSGVAQWLQSSGLQFVTDTATDPNSDSTFPIHEFLGWDLKRFAHRARPNQEALLIFNEDGTPWQAILDRPTEKKPYQYLAPAHGGNKAFLPHVPKAARQAIANRYGIEDKKFLTVKNFWLWVVCHEEIPIILTEGAKKAFSLLQFGYVAIGLYGCSCLGSPDLDKFLPGRKVTIAMDCDELLKTKIKVQKAVIKGAKTLATKGAKNIAIANWDTSLGKGIDDVLVSQGMSMVGEIIANAMSRTDYQQQYKETVETVAPKEAIAAKLGRSTTKKFWDTLEAEWGDRLRFNEMTMKVEKDEKEYDMEIAFLDVANELDIDCPARTAELIVKTLARRKSYHPFRDYLKSLVNTPGVDISNLATRYLGNNSALANLMLKKTLIAAVRRAFEPGCKVDTVCIFQGKTGYRKSTFWETLASSRFFCDNLSEDNRKDEKLKLCRYAIIEYSELETVWRRKDVSEMKAFLSSRIDSIRPPYGRSLEDVPRTSIFVGTTNKREILSDPTGERRYWVIEVNQRIDIEQLARERDQIWAEAVKQCLAGQIHYLTVEEDLELEQSNKDFKTSDTWEEVIAEYINAHQLQEISVRELLSNALKVEEKDQKKAEQLRCSDILQALGWGKGRRKVIDGTKTQLWQREINSQKSMSSMSSMSTDTTNQDTATASGIPQMDIPRTYPPESGQGMSTQQSSPQVDIPPAMSTQKTEVCPPSNPDSANVFSPVDIPDIPFSTPNFNGDVDVMSLPPTDIRRLNVTMRKFLTPEEISGLKPYEFDIHYRWQCEILSNTSPSNEIFQQLIPVAYLGALKSALLKTANKTGARARAIDKELDRREQLEAAILNNER